MLRNCTACVVRGPWACACMLVGLNLWILALDAQEPEEEEAPGASHDSIDFVFLTY